jgi:hypothetical protein
MNTDNYTVIITSFVKELTSCSGKSKADTIIDLYEYLLLEINSPVPPKLSYCHSFLWEKHYNYDFIYSYKENPNSFLSSIKDLSEIEKEEIILKLI